VIVTWNTKGTAGNVATTDTVTNGAWAAATLTGGVNSATFYDTSQNVSDTVETGWDFTEIVIIAVAAALIIAAIFSVVGGYIKI
jgi:nicotinamide riboside transporter PnuC